MRHPIFSFSGLRLAGNPAKDHEALFRISEDPACWDLFRFVLQTVMAYQATSKVHLVFSLVCILAALGSVRFSMQQPRVLDVEK